MSMEEELKRIGFNQGIVDHLKTLPTDSEIILITKNFNTGEIVMKGSGMVTVAHTLGVLEIAKNNILDAWNKRR